MAVAPTHSIDKRLAEMYYEKVTVNLDRTSSLDPEDFWRSMQLIAVNNKAFINYNRK